MQYFLFPKEDREGTMQLIGKPLELLACLIFAVTQSTNFIRAVYLDQ